MKQRTKGFIAVIISAVFFGLIPLFVKSVCAGGATSISASFYRMTLAILPLYIYLKIKKIPLKITKQELRDIILITAFGYGGTCMLLFASYAFIPSGLATTIHFVYPVFVILGSIIFLKEKVKPLKILCVALCTTAIVLFYNGDGGLNPAGFFLAFASGITYSFYIIYLDRSCLAKMPSLKLIFYMNTVAGVLLLAGALATNQFVYTLTPSAWVIAFVLAMGSAFVGALFFQKGVHMVGPQNSAILSTFEPITSLIVGIIAYNESFTLTGVVGCVLILTSVVIIAKMKE